MGSSCWLFYSPDPPWLSTASSQHLPFGTKHPRSTLTAEQLKKNFSLVVSRDPVWVLSVSVSSELKTEPSFIFKPLFLVKVSTSICFPSFLQPLWILPRVLCHDTAPNLGDDGTEMLLSW